MTELTGLDESYSSVSLQTAAECSVKISGQEMKHRISSLRLEQSVHCHHVLTLRLLQGGDIAERGIEFDDPHGFADFLGQPISVEIKPQGGVIDKSRKTDFRGIVTRISLDNAIDGVNTVTITGHSPTITMDGSRHNALFHEMSATDIISDVLSGHSITTGTVESSGSTLLMSVQNNETDYEYVMRLAGDVGLFAHYDGKEFRVVKASGSKPEELVWRNSLGALTVGLGTVAERFTGQSFDYTRHEEYDGKAEGSLRTSVTDLPRVSFDASEDMYAELSFVRAINADSQSALDATLEATRESAIGRMVTCTGKSIVPAVAAGHPVQIKMMSEFDDVYWVYSVTHVFDESGKYHNEFVCTPLAVAFPMKTSRPTLTDVQSAEVVSTDDPDDLGRIQIRFRWNDKNGSPAQPGKWVRVMSPHAGMERGLFSLPEEGDEVMVAFEHGDPDRPVVLGALYNGQNTHPAAGHEAGWDAAGNDLKLFRTRGGNEIYFSDKDGEEVLCIAQKEGKNKITLSVEGPSIAIVSEGDISIEGDSVTIKSNSGDVTIESGAAATVDATGDLTLTGGGNLKAEASMNAEITGGIKLDAKSPMTTVNGDSMLTLKGGMVMIN